MIEMSTWKKSAGATCGSCLKVIPSSESSFSLSIGPEGVSAARYRVLLCGACTQLAKHEIEAALEDVRVPA